MNNSSIQFKPDTFLPENPKLVNLNLYFFARKFIHTIRLFTIFPVSTV